MATIYYIKLSRNFVDCMGPLVRNENKNLGNLGTNQSVVLLWCQLKYVGNLYDVTM